MIVTMQLDYYFGYDDIQVGVFAVTCSQHSTSGQMSYIYHKYEEGCTIHPF